jgi:ribosomal protein L7Ae-like RNA K-turn-binding protein
VSGTRSVKDAVLKRRVKLLIFATDVPREKEEFFRKLETQVPTRTLADQETLGHWLGRDSLAVAAICSQGLATALMRELDRLTSLSFSSYHGN